MFMHKQLTKFYPPTKRFGDIVMSLASVSMSVHKHFLCLLYNSNTVWNILMILHSYVEQVRQCVAHKMRALTFISPLLFFYAYLCLLCNFKTLQCEYYHETSQLCTTGHDDVSHTRIITLAFILLSLMVSDAISCLLHNLNTLWYIIMFRTGHDSVSRTIVTTLAFIHF